MAELPYLYPRNRWWWYALTIHGERVRESGRPLGLSIDVPIEQARQKVQAFYGLAGAPPAPGAETLGWFREFLERTGDTRVAKSTWKLYLRDFSTFISVFGSDTPLRSIKAIPFVARFQDAMIIHGWRPVTVNIACRNIQAIFKRALRRGYIDINPFAQFERLGEGKQLKHMDDDELGRFLKAVHAWEPDIRRKSPHYYEGMKRLMYIYIYTAHRLNEVLTIARADIDLEKNELTIPVFKKRGKTGITHIIEIRPEICADLAWFLEHFPGDRPFRAFRPRAIERHMKVWLKAAGLPEDLHPHNLRHTSIPRIANEPNADLRAIQHYVGHSTITMTEKYVHGRPKGIVDFGKDLNEHRSTKDK